MNVSGRILLTTVAATTLAACGPTVAPEMVSWRAQSPVVTPASNPTAPAGALVVETDTDLKANGSETFFNVRRPYRVYSTDGTLVRRIVNRGGSFGEEPVVTALPPGRYVVSTMVGAVYRRLDVRVDDGKETHVTEDMLRAAPTVFTQVSAR